MKDYKSGLGKVFKAHLTLCGLQGLKYSAMSRVEQAILKNLQQIAMHAGDKRFSQGEVYMPRNLLALNQYLFMLKKMLPYVTTLELKTCMEIAMSKIEEALDFYGCPRFEEKDEILVVEVPADKDNYKALTIEQFEKWKGEFNRMLPIHNAMLYKKAPKNMGGFLNYNGNEKPAVDWVMANFEKPDEYIKMGET